MVSAEESQQKLNHLLRYECSSIPTAHVIVVCSVQTLSVSSLDVSLHVCVLCGCVCMTEKEEHYAVAYTSCVSWCVCVLSVCDVGRHQHPVLEEHVSHQPIRFLRFVSHINCGQGQRLPGEDHQSVFPQQQLQPRQELQTGPL